MRRFGLSPVETREIASTSGKSTRARKGACSLVAFPVPGKDAAEIADPVVEMTTVAVTEFLPSRVPVSGVTVHVLPGGEPAQIVMIGPVSPLTGVRVTWVVKVWPATTSADACLIEIVKSRLFPPMMMMGEADLMVSTKTGDTPSNGPGTLPAWYVAVML